MGSNPIFSANIKQPATVGCFLFARSHLCLHKGRRVYKKKRCRKARRLRLIWWESPAASEGIVFATGKRLIPSSPPRRAVRNVQPFPFTRRWDLRALHAAPWYAANPCPACWTARNPLTFFCCPYLARAYSVDARFRFVSPYKSHLLRQLGQIVMPLFVPILF